MAVSASALAFAALVASQLRRQAVRLRSNSRHGLHWGTSAGPLLSGQYRGHRVELTLAEDGLLCISARVINPCGIFAEFSQGDTPADWVPPLSAYRLHTLPERWSLAIRGSLLFFSCYLQENDPERIRRALDLTCDLADALDGGSGPGSGRSDSSFPGWFRR